MTRLCCALSPGYIIIPPIAGLKGIYIRDSRENGDLAAQLMKLLRSKSLA